MAFLGRNERKSMMTESALMYRPTTQTELLRMLGEYGDDAKLLAGGTAFTILRKAGLLQPRHVISVMSLPDLSGIARTEGGVSIGALTRLRAIEHSARVRADQPVLAAAVRLVANARVRNVATLGGNVSEADPTSDPPGVLVALDAVVHLVSSDAERDLLASEFFSDYFETAIRSNEFVSRVVVPDLSPDWGGTYVKFLSRSAEDRTCIGVAAFSRLDEVGVCHGLRLAIVGVGPVPLRIPDIENEAIGVRLDGPALDRIVSAYVDASDPITDVRGSADYRKRMMATLIPDAIARAGHHSNDAVFA